MGAPLSKLWSTCSGSSRKTSDTTNGHSASFEPKSTTKSTTTTAKKMGEIKKYQISEVRFLSGVLVG
jgi:hypothetical protein